MSTSDFHLPDLAETQKPSDMDRAFALYSVLADHGDEETLTYFVLPWTPVSKSRPRFGKGGRVYTTAEQQAAELRTATAMRRVVPSPMTGNVALGCVFFRPNKQRIDTDNMLKHVCDAANGVLWADDSQVTAIAGVTECDPEYPRTLIILGRHVSTMTRGSDAVRACTVCGKEFSILTGNPTKRTCSTRCKTIAMGYTPLDVPVPCAHCGKQFKRGTGYQTMCSAECRGASFAGKRRKQAKPKSTCPDCGTALAHARGGRCRDCWRASVRTEGAS